MNRFTEWIRSKDLDYKQYQYDGVEWCSDAEYREEGPQGGFLADEMGLGKTITMIGLFLVNRVRKTLIVVPTVLVDQWASQIYKTTGHRALIWKNARILPERILSAPIVITTYGRIALSKKKDAPPNKIHDIEWNRIVFDEAHHLRNKKTCVFMGAKRLTARARWLVSGTPVHNHIRDFYALCSVLGIAASDIDSTEDIVESYILRRTKEEVGIELPEIHLNQTTVDWKNEGEKRLAEEIHSTLAFSNVAGDKCRTLADAFSTGDRPTLKMMMRARQSCVLPTLFKDKFSDLIESGAMPKSHIYNEGIDSASKLASLIDLLVSRKNNGNGKLVFCQFHQEMDIVFKMLREKGVEDVVTFDGRTSFGKRRKMLLEKHDILILQIQTGCEGLNLQEHYSEIYFVSPHWNPCVEDQAVARCHRIGQTKPVHVYRFTMEGWGETGEETNKKQTISFDRHVSIVQDSKRELSRELFM